MAFGPTYANTVLDAVTSTLNVSLHTADPAGTGASEVSGGSYARQSATFGSASSKSNSNTGVVSFTDMPAATVTHLSLWDGATCVFYGPLSSSFVVSAGQTLEFGVGEISNVLS